MPVMCEASKNKSCSYNWLFLYCEKGKEKEIIGNTWSNIYFPLYVMNNMINFTLHILYYHCLKWENCNMYECHLLPEQMFTEICPHGSNTQISNCPSFSPLFSSLSLFLLLSVLSLKWRNGDVSRNGSERWRERYLISPCRLPRHLPPALLYSSQALFATSVFRLCVRVSSTHSYKRTLAHT